MIKLGSILISAFLIVGLVNGHGFMTDPPIRIKTSLVVLTCNTIIAVMFITMNNI